MGIRGGTGGTGFARISSACRAFGGCPSSRLIALISSDSCCSSRGISAAVVRNCAAAFATSRSVVTPPVARCCVRSQALLRDPDVVACDPQQGLCAAQLDVVARDLGQVAEQRVPPSLVRHLHRGGRGLHRSSHLAPQVEFPRSVEPDLVDIERVQMRTPDTADIAARGAVGAKGIGRIGEHPDIACLLSRVRAVGVERRKLRRTRHAKLGAGFRNANGGDLHVQILARDAAFQAGEYRIVEQVPPVRVDRFGDRHAAEPG